ncbi:MAG: hypothetical protein ACRBFS_14810 [Aureispira sp.]
MSIVQFQERLAVRIRVAILLFIFLLVLDNSMLFDIHFASTSELSTNLSTWLTAFFLQDHIIDSFSFQLIGIHILLLFVLFGAIKAPFRNIWVIQCTWITIAVLIIVSSYDVMEASTVVPVTLNAAFQSLKLIPLGLAYHWTRQLELPLVF